MPCSLFSSDACFWSLERIAISSDSRSSNMHSAAFLSAPLRILFMLSISSFFHSGKCNDLAISFVFEFSRHFECLVSKADVKALQSANYLSSTPIQGPSLAAASCVVNSTPNNCCLYCNEKEGNLLI